MIVTERIPAVLTKAVHAGHRGDIMTLTVKNPIGVLWNSGGGSREKFHVDGNLHSTLVSFDFKASSLSFKNDFYLVGSSHGQPTNFKFQVASGAPDCSRPMYHAAKSSSRFSAVKKSAPSIGKGVQKDLTLFDHTEVYNIAIKGDLYRAKRLDFVRSHAGI